jgi:hypothetical protein
MKSQNTKIIAPIIIKVKLEFGWLPLGGAIKKTESICVIVQLLFNKKIKIYFFGVFAESEITVPEKLRYLAGSSVFV